MAIRTMADEPEGMLGDLVPIVLHQGKLSESAVGLISDTLRGIIKKLNGEVSLGSGTTGRRAGNLSAQYIDHITPSVVDTEFVLPHGLGRTPVGYAVVRRDRAGTVYDSSIGSWNDTLLYLKADVASMTIKLLVW
jgi:hypothetical protein